MGEEGEGGRVYWNRRVLVSVSSCVCMPGFVQKISSEQLNLLYPSLIWWCIVLSRCHAQELGCYLQSHNKDLYNYNMIVSTISVQCCCFLLLFFTELSLLVDHHKPKHTLKMCYCCVKGQGHSNGSKFNLMFVPMVSCEPLKL